MKNIDDLKIIIQGIPNINPQDPTLIAVLRDEIIRLPFFFKYYKNIGIKHFIMIDNDSSDGSFQFLQNNTFDNEINITLYHTKDSYSKNNQGNLWREKIMKHYGENKWYLLVDIDELLFYDGADNNIKINEICKNCDDNGWNVFRSFCLDMYPNHKLNKLNYIPGESFFKYTPYFDHLNDHYTIKYNLYFKNDPEFLKSSKFYYDSIMGGVRKRCFNHNSALTEHILFKYNNKMKIFAGTHQIGPKKMIKKSLTRGIMLHFKWVSFNKDFIDKRIKENQMYDNSSDYKNYKKNSVWDMNFFDKKYSTKFIDSKQLKILNLLY